MAETGESYQQALARWHSRTQASMTRAPREVDLLCVDYFGARVTLATFQILGRLSCVVVPSSRVARTWGPLPQNPLFALAGARAPVH